jgi:Na+/H+-dicarboxylate symporter
MAAGILPARAIAVSTQSSLAILPAMVESAHNRLGSMGLPVAPLGLGNVTGDLAAATVVARHE